MERLKVEHVVDPGVHGETRIKIMHGSMCTPGSGVWKSVDLEQRNACVDKHGSRHARTYWKVGIWSVEIGGIGPAEWRHFEARNIYRSVGPIFPASNQHY